MATLRLYHHHKTLWPLDDDTVDQVLADMWGRPLPDNLAALPVWSIFLHHVMQCLSVPLFVWKFKFQVSFYQHSNVSQLAKRRLMLYDIVCGKMMHIYTDCHLWCSRYLHISQRICNKFAKNRTDFPNTVVKSASFYLKRFQSYGVLKNVQLFWPTLY